MNARPPSVLLSCRRHPLVQEVGRGLARAGVPDGAIVVVAVSGGADSLALLALIAGLAAHSRIVPVAAHVDHAIRTDSGLDRDVAADAASGLGIPFRERRLDLAPGASLAARARAARYAALAAMASDARAGWILTAHHADDQAETVLLSMARGAGLHGLAGMPAARDLASGVRLARPCLRLGRAQLRAACAELGLRWREDPGNARADTPRGRVRHAVLPMLEVIAPGAAMRIARSAEIAGEGCRALDAEMASLLGAGGAPDRSSLRAGSEARAATALRAMVGDAIDEAMFWRAAEAACDAGTDPRRFALRGGGELVIDAHGARVTGQGSSPDPRRHSE